MDGEERELMLFTNGFIISRVELDTLVNLLLDASSGRTTSHRRNSMLTDDEIAERFSDIDTDNSGGKYFLCIRCVHSFSYSQWYPLIIHIHTPLQHWIDQRYKTSSVAWEYH